MKKNKIIFFANPNSPHVLRWLEILQLEKYDVEILTIHKPQKEIGVKVHYIVPEWTKRLGFLNYMIAGFRLRSYLKNSFDLLHAHNSSGYGLMAYLSNYNYILTTYGSEIYEAKSRGKLYRYVIKVILDKATRITATSIKMKRELESKFKIKSNKIHLFSLGINTDIFYPKKSSDLEEFKQKYNLNDKTYWIINRKVTPLYNTKEVIGGFIKFINSSHKNVKLIVICGEYDKKYLHEIKRSIDNKFISSIIFIEKYLTQSELSNFLSISEYSISVPKSDQLSASILESLACSTIAILSNLEAYEVLKENSVAIFVNKYSYMDFYNIFNDIEDLNDTEKAEYISNAKDYISKFESNRSLINNINALYTKQSHQ